MFNTSLKFCWNNLGKIQLVYLLSLLIPLIASCSQSKVQEYIENGEVAFEANQYQEAVEQYNQVIENNKKLDNVYFMRGRAQIELGEYSKAVEDLDAAISLSQDKPEYYFFRAIAIFEDSIIQKDQNIGLSKEKAIQDLEKAISLDPENASYYRILALVQTDVNSKDRAIENIEKAVNLQPENVENYRILLTMVKDAQDAYDYDFDRVNKLFDEGVKFDRSKADIVLYRASFYFEHFLHRYQYESFSDLRFAPPEYMESLEQVIDEADKALSIDISKPEAHVLKSQALSYLREQSAAMLALEEGLKHSSDNYPIFVAKGNFHLALNEVDQAIEAYTEAINLEPEEPLAYLNRAEAYKLAKEVNKADQDRAKADEFFNQNSQKPRKIDPDLLQNTIRQ